jgi:hypothetical protein
LSTIFLGIIFLSIDCCRILHGKLPFFGWLAAAAGQFEKVFLSDQPFRLSEILLSSVGPVSPCFLCHIIFLLKLRNDATLTQFHPSYEQLLFSRKFACCCLSGRLVCSCFAIVFVFTQMMLYMEKNCFLHFSRAPPCEPGLVVGWTHLNTALRPGYTVATTTLWVTASVAEPETGPGPDSTRRGF